MPVTHVYVSTAPAVSGKVDSTEWNRAHTVSITNADIAADASIALTKLAAQAANSILAEGTGSSASPTAITVGEQTLVGRITGGNVDDLSITQVKTLLGVPDGSGTATQVAVWSDSDTLAAGNLIPPANLLTLVAAAPYTLTIPETGTVGLLGTSQVWTGTNKINANSTTAFFVEQDGVKDNVFVVDTTNGRVGVNMSPATAGIALDVNGVIRAAGTGAENVPSLLLDDTNTGFYSVSNVIYLVNNGVWRWAFSENSIMARSGGQMNYVAASLAAVTFLHNSDTNTGLSFSGSDALSLVTGGTQRLNIDSSGDVGIGTGATISARLHLVGNADIIQQIIKAHSTQIQPMFQLQDSSAVVHNAIYNPPTDSSTGVTEFNVQGSPYLDNKCKTDTYDAWFVDASNDSIVIMSNAAGKAGFFGATAIVQPANTVAIDTLLTNLGLRATGGTAFFDNRLALPMGEIGYFSTTGTAVVITTVSDGSTNMVKAAVTTTLNNDKDFDNGGANDGRLRYTGATTRTFHVACTISMSHDGANDVFVLGVAKNGTVDADCKVLQKITTAGDVQSTAIHCMVSLAQNDYVELYVGNITDANDAVIYTLNIFAVGM